MDSENDKKAKTELLKTHNNKKRLLEALEKTLGIVAPACKSLSLSRRQHYTWMETDPEYKAAVLDIQEVQKDFVESIYFQNIKKGDIASVLFYLKTRCRDRGYGEKQELAHTFQNTYSGISVKIKTQHD